MVVRERYPAGVPCWMEISTPDVAAAVDFYGGLFDWRFEARGPDGTYRVAQLDGQDVAGIGTPGPASPSTPAWLMYVAVDDVDGAARRVREAGGRVLDGPSELPGVGRSAICADPAGAVFGLWQSLGRAGAALVNAHGTWNFNELGATDPAAAAAFYGAVLDWRAVPVDFGAGQVTMWIRPGYVEFLASIDPDIRRRHAEAPTAPDDFSNAVAWMRETDGGTGGGWDVTFAVDDTDGITERAEKLGATVVIPPHDAGVVRMAALVDPQGAPFVVSHYQPEKADWAG
jgi:uncharacterized protein